MLLPEGIAGRLLRALARKVPGIPPLPMLMPVLMDGHVETRMLGSRRAGKAFLPGESTAAVTVRPLAF